MLFKSFNCRTYITILLLILKLASTDKDSDKSKGYCKRDKCSDTKALPGDTDTVETVTMSRVIEKIIESREQDEGMGARVRRSIGNSQLRNMDPFLLLDEFKVKKPAGFPDHPHRGFETVSNNIYILFFLYVTVLS